MLHLAPPGILNPLSKRMFKLNRIWLITMNFNSKKCHDNFSVCQFYRMWNSSKVRKLTFFRCFYFTDVKMTNRCIIYIWNYFCLHNCCCIDKYKELLSIVRCYVWQSLVSWPPVIFFSRHWLTWKITMICCHKWPYTFEHCVDPNIEIIAKHR